MTLDDFNIEQQSDEPTPPDDEQLCPECGDTLATDGSCENPDCPDSPLFDPEDSEDEDEDGEDAEDPEDSE